MPIDVINPNNGRLRETIACTPMAVIPDLVAQAARAQKSWGRLAFDQRVEAIRAAIGACVAEAATFARHIHEEMGKPVEQALAEVTGYASGLDDEVDAMRTALAPETSLFAGGRTTVLQMPLGVAAVITPWNFPFGMPLTLLVPALLAGNAVVFKPSEITPRTGLLLAEIFARHLPDGVLSAVVGAGDEGAALTRAAVDLIAFVGSRDTGKRIMAAAAGRVVRLLLELGGKDPMIVAADADLDAAAAFAARGSIRNSGQVCCSVERIYVERAAAAAFTAKVVTAVTAIAVGGDQPTGAFAIGPMATERQCLHVERQLREAIEAGAQLLIGGERLARDGFWLSPAVVTGLTDDMDIMRSETFGPVVCIQAVDSLSDGVAKANDTRYGLAATLWIGDQAKGEKLASALEAGLVGVNRSFGGGNAPWAGAKESGLGHTGGVSGARQFLHPRSVTIDN